MSKNINVAIVGVGRVGKTLLEKLLDHNGKGVTIVGVADKNPDAVGRKLALEKGIKTYDSSEDIVNLGDKVDVIFELTGDSGARRDCRMAMVKSENIHTVIAPETIAFLMWNIMTGGAEGMSGDAGGY